MTTMISKNGLSYPVQHRPSQMELATKRIASAVPSIMLKIIGGI